MRYPGKNWSDLIDAKLLKRLVAGARNRLDLQLTQLLSATLADGAGMALG
jgi:hypothetical protein